MVPLLLLTTAFVCLLCPIAGRHCNESVRFHGSCSRNRRKRSYIQKAVFGVAPTPPAPLLEPEPQIAASPRYAKNSSSSSRPKSCFFNACLAKRSCKKLKSKTCQAGLICPFHGAQSLHMIWEHWIWTC